MARPKEKTVFKRSASHSQHHEMSQAFTNKSQQEQDKLMLKIASGLTEDLFNLFEQELHSDVVVTNGNCKVMAHHCVLHSRAKHLWQEGLLYPASDGAGGDVKCLYVNSLAEKQITDCIRQLYCVADSELLYEEFSIHLRPPPNSEETITSFSVTKEEPSSADIVNDSTSIIDSNDFNNVHSQRDDSPVNDSDNNGIQIDRRDSIPLNSYGCDRIVDSENEIDTELNNRRNGAHENQNETKEEKYSDHLTNAGNKIHSRSAIDPNTEEENVSCDSHGLCPLLLSDIENAVSSLAIGNETVVHASDLEKRLTGSFDQEDGNQTSKPTGACSSTNDDLSVDLVREIQCSSQTEVVQERDENQVPQNLVCATIEEKESSEQDNEKTEESANENEMSNSNSLPDSRFVSPYQSCSPLGNDLLSLYLKQLHCDCCLSVEGVHLLAHKCILSARSPYFSAMFGGQWSESRVEVVNLEGVSASAMEKVLLFFYGGVIDVISSSDILDLFIIADMYGVETLKLALQFYLRKDMCHFFHKPCSVCIAKAPEALSLCHNFHLEELQERLLKWMSKHFTKIWCTKTFGCQPEVLHQLCLEAVVSQMTEVNVLDTILDCDQLTTSLPRIKWTESLLGLTTQLMDLAIEYTSTNFIKVINAPEFLAWAKTSSWKASALEDIFNSVIDSLPVDTAISVYQTLIDFKARETAQESSEQNLLDLLDTMIKRCEKFLRTHIHHVARSKQWSSINKSFQSQILENSSYFHLDHFPDPKPRPKRPVMSSTLNKPKMSSSSASTSSSQLPSSQTSKRLPTSSATGKRPARGKPSLHSSSRDGTVAEKATHRTGSSSLNISKQNKLSKTAAVGLTAKSTHKSHPNHQDPKINAPDSDSLNSTTSASVSINSQNMTLSDPTKCKVDVENQNPPSASLLTDRKSPILGKSPTLGQSAPSSSLLADRKSPILGQSPPSASLLADRKSPILGKSPPSKLPLRTHRCNSHETAIADSQESTLVTHTVLRNGDVSSEETPCFEMARSSPDSTTVVCQDLDARPEISEGLDGVVRSATNINSSDSAKLPSSKLEECEAVTNPDDSSRSREHQNDMTVAEDVSLISRPTRDVDVDESTHCDKSEEGKEDGGDNLPSHHRVSESLEDVGDNPPSHHRVSESLEDVGDNPPSHHRVSESLEDEQQICVQLETNFVTTQPFKVSFVVPSNDSEKST